MMTNSDHPLGILVDKDGLQNKALSKDQGGAGWPVVLWVLLLAHFEDWGDIHFLPVLRHLS